MLEPIIQYFVDKGELHERAAYDARSFVSYLEKETEYSRNQLKEVIQRFNPGTLEPGVFKCFPQLQFWRGTDGFDSVVALDYDGSIDIVDGIEPIVKGRCINNLLVFDLTLLFSLRLKILCIALA
jgi:hypothetical protein